ncbi:MULTISPECIES: chemotaxis protein CheW [unclassified Elioraea]|jgi:purine-binding chemotaxis protein CheW|uniref:chemotaxis protein CheW n=1 Tax=unclassified Elioraea TaxID=2619524 RepID=UPI00114F52BF|nr:MULTISPECIES: chemotaxis protein CheW [unclassified Elioraea]TQF77003.1 chemotaxis protein CheW [Elioraea sp. Yellowstone]GIX09717.1 MAG: chemotaxis protein CheW [Elioraea sp.]
MSTTAEITRPGQASRGANDEARDVYVTLVVGGQLCGIPVLAVRDILGPQAITRIPLAPPEVAGSLNLRGRIVTAIDLRRRLGVGAASSASMSVVVEHQGELYSLLVDSVGEVMRLEAQERERNPPTLAPEWRGFSAGIFRLSGELLVVLDVAAVLDL